VGVSENERKSVCVFVCAHEIAVLTSFFCNEPYERDYILQKRPIILRILLIVDPLANTLRTSTDFAFVRERARKREIGRKRAREKRRESERERLRERESARARERERERE